MVLSDGGEKQCRTVEGTRVSRWRRGDGGDGGYDGEEVIVVIGDGVRRGTFGYLDPEYFQSGQFTEKSEVYSFAVVLVELLTGQKPISSIGSNEVQSLSTYFLQTMEENRIFDIIDERVRNERQKKEIIGVANLARRCLNLSRKKRPTMKEVAMELEAIKMSKGASTIQQHYEKVEYDINEFSESWETASTSTSTVHIDIQPLLVQ
ncbi:hypothetical protein LguiA_026373 [Lonicera macranthoides]